MSTQERIGSWFGMTDASGNCGKCGKGGTSPEASEKSKQPLRLRTLRPSPLQSWPAPLPLPLQLPLTAALKSDPGLDALGR
eukprot:3146483-Alexandrium_andersonii.AAC.1